MKRILQWLNGKEQAWFNHLVLFVGFISGLITIIDFIVRFAKSFQKHQIFVFFYNHALFVRVLALAGWIVFSFTLILKYRTSAINKMEVSAKGLNEIIRITILQMKKMEEYDRIISSKSEMNCGDCSILRKIKEEFISSYVLYTIDFLDKLSNVINIFCSANGNIALSYKMIVPDSIKDSKLDCTVTLARSSNTSDVRKNTNIYNPTPIIENSDFNSIVSADINQGGKNYFYVNDLREYQRKIEKDTDGHYKYLNSNPDWFKYYNCTMVVPVGSPEENGEIYGFLCADSMDSKNLPLRQKDINIRLFFGYARIYGMVVRRFAEIEKKMWKD